MGTKRNPLFVRVGYNERCGIINGTIKKCNGLCLKKRRFKLIGQQESHCIWGKVREQWRLFAG